MDDQQFLGKLKAELDSRLSGFETQIIHSNLPTSVEFIVTSPDFEGMPLGQRMSFVTEALKSAFGPQFYSHRMVGSAMTPSEKTEYDDRGNHDSEKTTSGGNYDRSASSEI